MPARPPSFLAMFTLPLNGSLHISYILGEHSNHQNSAAISEVGMVPRLGNLHALPSGTEMIMNGVFRGFEKAVILYPWREVESEVYIDGKVGKKRPHK